MLKLSLVKGERVCLIGRNGAGKSSLLKVIDGTILPDSGSVWRKPGLIIAMASQELPQNKTTTVYEFVAEGLADTGKNFSGLLQASERMAHSHTPGDLVEFEKFHHEMDARNAWQFEQQITTIMTRLELNPDHIVANCQVAGSEERL